MHTTIVNKGCSSIIDGCSSIHIHDGWYWDLLGGNGGIIIAK